MGRSGERRFHLAVALTPKTFEAGAPPGKEAPVFGCGFGKIGIQIRYDMEFERGWRQLAGKRAELIAFPTQSPHTVHPSVRAKERRWFIATCALGHVTKRYAQASGVARRPHR
jgi:predicted amidohydrolase